MIRGTEENCVNAMIVFILTVSLLLDSAQVT